MLEYCAIAAAARRYSRHAVDRRLHPHCTTPVVPVKLNDAGLEGTRAGLFFGNAVMSKCSEVRVFGNTISAGMEAEIKRACWKDYRCAFQRKL